MASSSRHVAVDWGVLGRGHFAKPCWPIDARVPPHRRRVPDWIAAHPLFAVRAAAPRAHSMGDLLQHRRLSTHQKQARCAQRALPPTARSCRAPPVLHAGGGADGLGCRPRHRPRLRHHGGAPPPLASAPRSGGGGRVDGRRPRSRPSIGPSLRDEAEAAAALAGQVGHRRAHPSSAPCPADLARCRHA